MASKRLKATELLGKIRQANGVVENSIGAIIIGIGTPNNTNDWKVLALSTGYGIENAKATDTPRPSIAICSIASIDLVAAPYDIEPRFGNQMVKQAQVEVSGDREHVGDTDLDEPPSDVVAESGVGWSYVGEGVGGGVLKGICPIAWRIPYAVCGGLAWGINIVHDFVSIWKILRNWRRYKIKIRLQNFVSGMLLMNLYWGGMILFLILKIILK